MEGERKPVDSGWGVGLFSGAERAPWSPEQLFVCPGMGVGGEGTQEVAGKTSIIQKV